MGVNSLTHNHYIMLKIGDWVVLNPNATMNMSPSMSRIAANNPVVQITDMQNIKHRAIDAIRIEFEEDGGWNWIDIWEHFRPLKKGKKISKPKKIELIW